MGSQSNYIIGDFDKLAATGLATGLAYTLLRHFGMNKVKVKKSDNPYKIGDDPRGVPDAVIKTSVLGTPILTNLVIAGGSFVDKNGTTQFWSDIEVDNIIMTVSQTKKIVTTVIQGKDNDVKEYIGMSDYDIDLKGALFGGYNQYPKDDVAELKKALDAGQPLALASWWLQMLNIDTAVVFTFDMPQTEGEYSTQYFTASLKSDVPVEVRITGGQ